MRTNLTALFVLGAATVVASCTNEAVDPASRGTTSTGGGMVGGHGGMGSAGSVVGIGGSGGSDVIWCGQPQDCSGPQFCAPDGTCHDGYCDTGDVGCIFGFDCICPFCGDQSGQSHDHCYQSPDHVVCASDADCSTADRCLSGTCTHPADQCFDGTQCSPDSVCVDGKCIASCANGQVCPSSYTCTAVLQACTTPAASCTTTNDCGSADLVCVDGACFPRA